jgi:prepilin-type N-terminal cleavage/methylation domain-containing protein
MSVKKTNKGFTMVELIVVIAVLLILAVIAVVVFSGIIENARRATIISDANTIARNLNTANSIATGSISNLNQNGLAAGTRFVQLELIDSGGTLQNFNVRTFTRANTATGSELIGAGIPRGSAAGQSIWVPIIVGQHGQGDSAPIPAAAGPRLLADNSRRNESPLTSPLDLIDLSVSVSYDNLIQILSILVFDYGAGVWSVDVPDGFGFNTPNLLPGAGASFRTRVINTP